MLALSRELSISQIRHLAEPVLLSRLLITAEQRLHSQHSFVLASLDRSHSLLLVLLRTRRFLLRRERLLYLYHVIASLFHGRCLELDLCLAHGRARQNVVKLASVLLLRHPAASTIVITILVLGEHV